MSPTPQRSCLQDYPYALTITTRWHDNDVYGHVNNVQYYAFFDTAVNRYLIERKVLDIHCGAVIGLVVETSCRYFAPIAFPDLVVAAVRVDHLGNSSVRYAIGLFRAAERSTGAGAAERSTGAGAAELSTEGAAERSTDGGAAAKSAPALELQAMQPTQPLDPATEAVAEGHFVHVYVDRHTRRPTPLPGALRKALLELRVQSPEPGKSCL